MAQKNFYEPRRRARRRALQAIYQRQLTGQDANDILRQFLEIQNMEGVDSEHFEKLLRGVERLGEELDAELQPMLDRPVGQLSADLVDVERPGTTPEGVQGKGGGAAAVHRLLDPVQQLPR